MERAIRPEARPGVAVRAVVAVGLSTWTVVQALLLVAAAAKGGVPQDAATFVLRGVLIAYLAGASWLAWIWVARGRPRSYALPDEDATTRRHTGLSGEHELPTRW